MKTLVLGLGNPVASDDRVGLLVARRLKPLLADRSDVEVDEDYWGGIRLMERLVGYTRAVIVDAIVTGGPPGTIHRLAPHSIPTQHSASAHDVNLPTALKFGRQAGVALPPDDAITLIGVEAEDVLTISEECTPAVLAAVPEAIREVLRALELDEKAGERPADALEA